MMIPGSVSQPPGSKRTPTDTQRVWVDGEATDTQHFLERAKILLRCLQPEDAKEEEDVEEMATPRFVRLFSFL